MTSAEPIRSEAQEITVTLPDGTERLYPVGVTGKEIAESIGAGLAKAALAVKINGFDQDLNTKIHADSRVAIITRKSEEALEIIRHDAAHIMAMAVQELFVNTQVTIGPAIENGFYYDFHREQPFTPEDFEKIETKMREIIERDLPTRREVWERDRAIAYFKGIGEHFKAELVEAIPQNEAVSVYFHGDAWCDLCRGPHLSSTGEIGSAFKIMKTSGSYWRGDAKNPPLQRLYGTAWRDEKELKQYLFTLEEAERRDHRKIGREMKLFHQQEEAPGMIFWHPKGTELWIALESYMRRLLTAHDYKEIRTPQLVDRKLWEESGHWEKFAEHMYVCESEERIYALKPMNCPCHVQIFNNELKSYRQLPLRLAEFGSCHRYEPSGALHGIMRVRNFTQDDAHIFCTEEQITSETRKFCELLARVYKDLGFESFRVKFSDRPEKRAGSDEIWDKAENSLKKAVEEAGYSYELNPGEGAFYGPKLEFVLRDAIGRDWQCGTLQADFVLPDRLGATYVAEDGAKKTPVMLHRAILGSMERFIGILTEQYAGRFPLWLAPTQVVIVTITDEANEAAKNLEKTLRANGVRTEIDLRNEKINYKVREHMSAGVPILAVLGKKEAVDQTVSVRRSGGGDKNDIMDIEKFVSEIKFLSTPPDLQSSLHK